MHGTLAFQFGIGPRNGDVTTLDFTQWQDIDVLVAGPPCPPWSSIGVRHGVDDERAALFAAVSNMIKCHGKRTLKLFVIEMVCAQDHKSSRNKKEMSFCKSWVAELATCMPEFCITCHRLNSADYLLPQHRIRLYTVGVRKSCSGMTSFPQVPPLPRQSPEGLWAQILHRALPDMREDALTKQQQQNLLLYKHMALEKGVWQNPICVSVDRDPRKGFGCFTRYDGSAMTLRCTNDLCWLIVMDASGTVHLSRPIHPMERFALQGFSARHAGWLTKLEMLRVTGNAMSVPVVGAVFVGALCCLATAAQPVPHMPFKVDRRAALMQLISLRIRQADAQRLQYEAALAIVAGNPIRRRGRTRSRTPDDRQRGKRFDGLQERS